MSRDECIAGLQQLRVQDYKSSARRLGKMLELVSQFLADNGESAISLEIEKTSDRHRLVAEGHHFF